MKHIFRTSVISLLLLALAGTPAHANDKAWAALGGFVAGVITGVAIEDARDRDWGGEVAVSVGASYGWDHRGSFCFHAPDPCRHGHWEIRRVRVWVPGHWEIVIDRCGTRTRAWRGGYHEWRRERVWVPCRCCGPAPRPPRR